MLCGLILCLDRVLPSSGLELKRRHADPFIPCQKVGMAGAANGRGGNRWAVSATCGVGARASIRRNDEPILIK